MRNLKRALSLTLASVMLLGMMVVGSSAAAGYDDVADTDNVEAIEVAQAVGIMIGDENDNFRPGDPVSRAEMAVVMGKLLSLDYNYYEATCPFTDVSGVYDWARGWVGACYANGIVSGRGEGIYDPGATVTAVETASMLMRALGYFKYQSDYANGFEVATVSQATKINLFDGVNSKTNEPLTRNQVAQMVLNALKSGTVEPDGNALNFVDVNGNVIATGGKVNYVFVTSNKAFAQAISSVRATAMGSANDSPIVELGERLFNGDLKLYDPTSDDFERPSRTWEYKGLEVGTYMKVENIKETYTAGVNIRTLYDLLGRSSLQEYTVSRYVDGVLADTTENAANTILSRQDKDLAYTGRGVLTQVFVDTTEKTIDITSINTYLAQATTDYNKNNESAMLEIFTVAKEDKVNGIVVSAETKSAVKTVDQADVPEIVDVAKDTYYLVNVTGKYMNASASDLDVKSNTDLSRFEVAVIDNVEIMSDATLTKFSKNSDQDTQSNQNEAFFKSLVTGGTEYKSSARAAYSDEVLDLYAENLLVNKTYNVFLDDYGYAIGVDLYSGDNNYVFITGFDPSGSYITLGTATAAAIFTDGTMSTIKVNVKDTNKNIDKVDNIPGTYFEKWEARAEQKTDPKDDGMFSSKATINRWYTYTVNSAGEYILNPATRMITTEVTAKDEVIKCNSVRIDENPARMYDNGWAAYDFDKKAYVNGDTRTYGNDDSIFIVVDIDEKADLSKGRIINDVSGVYTGVQNVEINVKSKGVGNDATLTKPTYLTTAETGTVETALYDSIYTLYDKNNYIIASVIIGDAKGGNANYAYILSAAKSEERLSDGTTLWTFDAIVDGKITTLTTSDKFTKVINQLEPGHIQELRYTGDYVTGVKTPENDNFENYYTTQKAFTLGTQHSRITDEGIYDVGHDFNAVSYHDNDCAQTASEHIANITDDGHLATINGKWVAADLRVIGRTMYLNRTESLGALGADYGLTFVQDAPAVVLHKVDGDWKKLEFSSVAQAVSELGDADPDVDGKQFAGRVVAPLNDQGVAKWIVFISDTEITTHGAGSVTRNAEIKFNMGDYPVDRYSFYVNGKRVTEDEIVSAGSGLVSFRAPVGASVNIVKLPGTGTLFGNNGDSWIIGYNDAVTGIVSDEGGTLNFTAKSTTLYSRYNYVTPVDYTVSVDAAIANGTVTVSPNHGYAGTDIKVTANAADGYELKTLTYSYGGNSYNVTNGSFKMPASHVVVSATFELKATEPTGTVTATWVEGDKNSKADIVIVDAADSSVEYPANAVPANKPFKFIPSVAVTVADGQTGVKAGTEAGTWVATGDFKVKSVNANKYKYTGSLGWVEITETGFKPIIDLGMASTVFSVPQARFSLARSASNETQVTPDPRGAWIVDAQKNNKTIEIRVPTDDGTVVFACDPKEGFEFTLDKSKYETTAAWQEALIAGLDGLDGAGVTFWTIGKSETPDEPTVDYRTLPVQANVSLVDDKYTATFNVFFAGKSTYELTASDVAKALTAATYPTEEGDVNMDTLTATSTVVGGKKDTIDFSGIQSKIIVRASNNSTTLYKVEYPGGKLYLPYNTQSVLDNISTGVRYLIPETNLGVASGSQIGVTIVDAKATLNASRLQHMSTGDVSPVTDSVKYVEAIQVKWATLTGYAAPVLKVTSSDTTKWARFNVLLSKPGSTDKVQLDTANHAYVQKNTQITLQQAVDGATDADKTNATRGQVITILKNGVKYGADIVLGDDKVIPVIDPITVDSTVPDGKTDANQFTLSVALGDAIPTTDAIKVYLNNELLEINPDNATYNLRVQDKTCVIVKENRWKGLEKLEAVGTPAAGKVDNSQLNLNSLYVYQPKDKTLLPDGTVNDEGDLYDETAAGKGEVRLYTAYEVYGSSSTVKVYKNEADAKNDRNHLTSSKALYVKTMEKEPTTVFIMAENAHDQIVWVKDGTCEGFEYVPNGENSLTEGSAACMWKVNVKGNVTYSANPSVDTIMKGYTINLTQGKLKAEINTLAGAWNAGPNYKGAMFDADGLKFNGKTENKAQIGVDSEGKALIEVKWMLDGYNFSFTTDKDSKNRINVRLESIEDGYGNTAADLNGKKIAEIEITLTTGQKYDMEVVIAA